VAKQKYGKITCFVLRQVENQKDNDNKRGRKNPLTKEKALEDTNQLTPPKKKRKEQKKNVEF